MTELKTKATAVKVEDFLDKVEPEEKRQDSYTLLKMMEEVTGAKAKMWGPSIVGFGQYHYKYDSGHEGDMCITGFSPRKAALTVYAVPETLNKTKLFAKLGKHKLSKACIYIKKLTDIDLSVLRKIIEESVEETRKKYPTS